jgi:hypothetical protein
MASAVAASATNDWTTDGGPPIIIWYVNAHGAMNEQSIIKFVRKFGIILVPTLVTQGPYEDKDTGGMVVSGYSIAGNQNQCGLMGKLKGIPEHEGEHYEFNGKGLDYCIPSLMRKIFYDCEQKAKDTHNRIDQDKCFNKAIQQVNTLYQRAGQGQYSKIFANGGFQPMTHPTRYHYYQLYANPGENTRPTGQPMRTVAKGDIKYSEAKIYGVWVVYTNIKVISHISLTSITNRELSNVRENLGRRANHLFLPPELLNPVNMAGRRKGRPTGAAHWIRAIQKLAKYNYLTPEGELSASCEKAVVLLDNMWRRRETNLHDILDIFRPFHIIGERLVGKPTTVRTIDVTCRSYVGTLFPPNPAATPVIDTHMLESQDMWSDYDDSRVVKVPSDVTATAVAEYDHDSVANDSMADPEKPYPVSPPSITSRPSKSRPSNVGRPTMARNATVTGETVLSARPPWKGGGAKRKYSRKRNTRTRNRYTRRRRTPR